MTTLKYFEVKTLSLFHEVTSNILTFIALKWIQSITYFSRRNILKMEKKKKGKTKTYFGLLNSKCSMPTFQWIPLLPLFIQSDFIAISLFLSWWVVQDLFHKTRRHEEWGWRAFLFLDWKFFNNVSQMKVVSIQEVCRDADPSPRYILAGLLWQSWASTGPA